VNGFIDHLYTHSELQVITTPPLTSTIQKSPQYPLSLFQPSMSSPAIPWQRLLSVEILQLHTLKSSLHRLPYRNDLVTPIDFLITPRHGPHRNTPFPTAPLLVCFDSLLQERVYRVFAQKRPWFIRPSRGRCIELVVPLNVWPWYFAFQNIVARRAVSVVHTATTLVCLWEGNYEVQK
jgi:hypothetical protein